MSACSEATVTHPTPSATVTPLVISSLPPIGFNHRYGNNPVAAADAFAMERTLFSQKQYWEVGMHSSPVEAGYVDETDPKATARARSQVTDMVLIMASESLPTIRGMIAHGDPGQQTYCEQFVTDLRAMGYNNMKTITVTLYWGESDRHAELTWNARDGYKYTIFDNNLNGSLNSPIPSSTPFSTPPSH